MKLLLLMPMEVSARSVAQAAQDAAGTSLSVQAFYHMAFWALAQFARHEELQSLSFTSYYRNEAFPDEQLVEVQHHLKVVAHGKDLGLSQPDAQQRIAAEIAPTRFLGNGTFTLERSLDLVEQFDLAVSSGDQELADSIVHRMATRLFVALGQFSLVHRMNSFF